MPSRSRFGGNKPIFNEKFSAKQGVIFIFSSLSLLSTEFSAAGSFIAGADDDFDGATSVGVPPSCNEPLEPLWVTLTPSIRPLTEIIY